MCKFNTRAWQKPGRRHFKMIKEKNGEGELKWKSTIFLLT